jgi:ABC-type antimicrobial peptide transport system permease subunit
MALGSERASVRRSVLARTLRLTVIGLMLGSVGAVLTSRAVDGLVFGVTSLDPASYVIAAAVLTLVALLAGDGPARTASGLDPQTVLREE